MPGKIYQTRVGDKIRPVYYNDGSCYVLDNKGYTVIGTIITDYQFKPEKNPYDFSELLSNGKQ